MSLAYSDAEIIALIRTRKLTVFGDGKDISTDVRHHYFKEALSPKLKIKDPFNLTPE